MAKSIRFVIDACVARASGPPGSTQPTSSRCRDFLVAVRSNSHRMVMSDSIKTEWDKHQSNFARGWRVSMVARKGIEFLKVEENVPLRSKIQVRSANAEIAAIIIKDLHLVEAAIATDQRIVSIEKRVFDHLRTIGRPIKDLLRLAYANPSDPTHDTVRWVEESAPIRSPYKLLS